MRSLDLQYVKYISFTGLCGWELGIAQQCAACGWQHQAAYLLKTVGKVNFTLCAIVSLFIKKVVSSYF